MSTNKRRKPVGSAYPKPGLRLMKSSEVHPARLPKPDLARALEDLKRRYREWGVWEERRRRQGRGVVKKGRKK